MEVTKISKSARKCSSEPRRKSPPATQNRSKSPQNEGIGRKWGGKVGCGIGLVKNRLKMTGKSPKRRKVSVFRRGIEDSGDEWAIFWRRGRVDQICRRQVGHTGTATRPCVAGKTTRPGRGISQGRVKEQFWPCGNCRAFTRPKGQFHTAV
ncbi:unnamed protein product [Linum trigynum]|uniref:Uncharacterized protein n=1 Tax=Linum trigynum TaxID=586398 RepID=A0AAV2E534_9ROSI